ncbi:Valine--pyruvate aminotransferase [Exophiala oligosperma]
MVVETSNTAALAHIDLQKGWPTPRLLPRGPLLEAAEATLSDPKRATEAMLYGPNIGDPALRKECAEWLSRLYRSRSPPAGTVNVDNSSSTTTTSVPISPERICITAGASGNLACIMAAFSDPVYTRRVWMVEPTYFLACTVFDDAGFQGRLVGVPEDADGMDVDRLRSMIEVVDGEEKSKQGASCVKETANGEQEIKQDRSWADGNVAGVKEIEQAPSLASFKRSPQYPKLYRHIIYLVPTFSNPSSKTYPLERREALVRLAREKDALLITDDCYDFLSWSVETRLAQTNGSSLGASPTPFPPPTNGSSSSSNSSRTYPPPPPPPRLVDVDSSLPGGDLEWGNAVSNGSFSKVVGPGMRCGWAEATPKFILRLNRVGATLSGGAPGQFSSTLIEHLLRTGALEGHIRNVLIPLYQHRSAILRQAIHEYLEPLGVKIDTGASYKVDGPDRTGEEKEEEEVFGGFFLYILFPEGIRSDQVARIALDEYNLRILSSGMMAVRGSKTSCCGREWERERLSRGTRLCWAWHEEEQLVEGVQRIARVLKEKMMCTVSSSPVK